METTKIKTKRKYPESELRQNCLKWLAYQHPEVRKLVISIENEGKRTTKLVNGRYVSIGGARAKLEGLNTGASDIFIAKHHNSIETTSEIHDNDISFYSINNIYYGLFIEFKAKGKLKNQSEKQKEFQVLVEKQGYKYALLENFDDFEKLINNYLK